MSDVTRADGGHANGGHVPRVAGAGQFRRLAAVLAISVAVLVVEVVGGLVSGSLALLADAGHVLADVGGLALALFAMRVAARPPTPERTFGFLRVEALSAFANAALLLVVAINVVVEAVRRFTGGAHIESGGMLVVALVGLAGNALGLLLLHRGKALSLTLRGAYLEVLGDLLGSVAVVAAAVVIGLTGFEQADAIASLLIAALIAPRAVSLARAAVDVLLESAPRGMDLAQVRRHITDVDHVVDVHDLHAWTLGTGVLVLSAHVVVEDSCFHDGHVPVLLDQLQSCLAGHFDVEHSTFQLEAAGHGEHELPTHP